MLLIDLALFGAAGLAVWAVQMGWTPIMAVASAARLWSGRFGMNANKPNVVIAGIGQTDVGELWDVSLRDLGVRAIQAAREDAGGLAPQALFIGNMLAASASHQANLGALLCEWGKLRQMPGRAS